MENVTVNVRKEENLMGQVNELSNGKMAFRKLRQEAKRNRLQNLSQEDINEEIRGCRYGKEDQ